MNKTVLVRRDLLQALIAILSQGIQLNELDNSEKLLTAIRILSPDLQGLDEFSSYIAIKRGFVQEALQTYASTPADNSKWYVMMALCLKLTGDPTWHWHAAQSLEKEDSSARYAHNLARILLGLEAVEESPMSAEPYAPASGRLEPSVSPAYANYLAV